MRADSQSFVPRTIVGLDSNGAATPGTTHDRMTEQDPAPEIADEVPWSDHVTEYEDRLNAIYLRLLDADAEGASKGEMARDILGIDTASERSALARPWTATLPAPAG